MLTVMSTEKGTQIELQIEVIATPTPPPATFSNYVSISVTTEEVVLDFCELLVGAAKVESPNPVMSAYPRHRVILTTAHAGRLANTITKALALGGYTVKEAK